MYNLTEISEQNAEPWNIPFASRWKAVNKAITDGQRVAVLLYEQADTSTFRYRGYNVMQATADESEWKCIYFFNNEFEHLIPMLKRISLISIIRFRWTRALDRFIKYAKNHDIPIIFDVDDLVFDVNYLPMVTNIQNANELDYDWWFAYIGRIGMSASFADGFTTTNDYLGKMLQNRFGKPFSIIPNFLNDEQIIVSETYRKQKQNKSNTKPFTIGYFSGSPSHINDFKVVSIELKSLLIKYPDMQLKVVGFMDFPSDMKPLIESDRISFTPLVDFLKLQQLIAEVDVNIAPLVASIFTNCKSELKFFEAAIVDTITLASPTYVYKTAIQNGETGFLCNPGQWYEIIEKIYQGEIDKGRIQEAARAYTMKHYRGELIYKQINEAYNALHHMLGTC